MWLQVSYHSYIILMAIDIYTTLLHSAYAPCKNWGEEGCIQIVDGKARRKETTRRPRCRWVDNIKMDLRNIGWNVWIELISLRIGISGRLLRTRYGTFRSHKMLGSRK
jgi:hypothetical protein